MIKNDNNEDRMIRNHNPKGLSLREPIDTLINSVCLAMSYSWEKSFKLLYAQAHKFCNIPTSAQCMNGLLDDLGFKKVRLREGEHRLSPYEMLALLDKRIGEQDTVILKLRVPYRRGYVYAAICFRTFDGEYYHKLAAGAEEHLSDAYVMQVRVRAASAEKKEGAQKGYQRTKLDDTPLAKESDTLLAVNENPDGRRVGDCVLRGVAACLGVDWHTALDMIAEANEYAYPTFNRVGVFDKLLIKEGFEECSPLKKDGRAMNGDQFCRYIRDMYPEGTVFLAEIGNDHVAAIKLINDSYKVYDTWDSTKIRIPRFWVRYPKQKAERRPRRETAPTEEKPKLPIIRVGEQLRHKVYGIGTVTSVDRCDSYCFVSVDFGDKGLKKLDESWIMKNCTAV